MSDWVQRALEAYQAVLDERNAYIAKQQRENMDHLTTTASWLLDQKIDPKEAYFVEPDSYRLKITHEDYSVIFTLISSDRFIGVLHTCPQCGAEYTSLTRSPAELGELLVEGPPPHAGCPGALSV